MSKKTNLDKIVILVRCGMLIFLCGFIPVPFVYFEVITLSNELKALLLSLMIVAQIPMIYAILLKNKPER